MLKTLLVLPIAMLGFAPLGLVRPASAAGCVSGAAVGGVAGHFVGHGHAVLGAAVGCAVGVHEKHKQQRQAARAETPPSTSKSRK